MTKSINVTLLTDHSHVSVKSLRFLNGAATEPPCWRSKLCSTKNSSTGLETPFAQPVSEDRGGIVTGEHLWELVGLYKPKYSRVL